MPINLARLSTAGGLVVVAALCWFVLIKSGAVMATMTGDGLLLDVAYAMMQPAATTPYLIATAVMWVVMMIAMMTPAVLPVALLFQRLDRRGGDQRASLDGLAFATGYLLLWAAFGILATAVQWTLHRAALLHTHLLAGSPLLAGSLLLGAGLYQLTPLKTACLKHCQTPLGFLLSHWREGTRGALVMGLHHAAYCMGCCWALMGVLFAVGVMNLVWVAALTIFVLLEKAGPAGAIVSRLGGAVMIVLGIVQIVMHL